MVNKDKYIKTREQLENLLDPTASKMAPPPRHASKSNFALLWP